MEEESSEVIDAASKVGSRKRPRPKAPDDATPASASESESASRSISSTHVVDSPPPPPLPQVLLTPHTRRLLKLVQDGSAEHAQLASIQLASVTYTPVVVWDILGRLQEYLTGSRQWRTRHNASVAMEGVAQQLPLADQRSFLQQTWRDRTAATASSHAWLTLDDLSSSSTQLELVLEQGRPLLAASSTKYDGEEERALGKLDAACHSKTFVQQRTEFQRRILARRLGLSIMLTHVGSGKDVVDTILSTEDLAFPSAVIASKGKGGKPRAPSKNNASSSSIRSLLVLEIQKKQQSRSSSSTNSDTNGVSQQSAQSLLATELVFRMFDASWHIRHGSLMGILALTKAWKTVVLQHLTDDTTAAMTFGQWPHDILVRCLCVLALDRFADFSETSTSSESGGIVAPIREMAGQVVAVLYHMAPEVLQQKVCSTLQRMVAAKNDWEVRHGALIGFKYIVALSKTTSVYKGSDDSWSKDFHQTVLELAATSLGDDSDDVQGVAAQVLSECLSPATCLDPQLISRIVPPLWKALQPSRLISSSLKDLVHLFSALIEANFAGVLDYISREKDGCACIFPRLQSLLECPYTSVNISVIGVVGRVTKHLAKHIMNSTGMISPGLSESFCDMMKTVFDIYDSHSLILEDKSNDDYHAFLKACHNTWGNLVEASSIVMSDLPKERSDLGQQLLLRYFRLQSTDAASGASLPTHVESFSTASFGRRHRLQVDLTDALAIFLVSEGGHMQETQSSHQILELCLCVCLESPFLSHVQRACLLVAAMARQTSNPSTDAVLQGCRHVLHKAMQEGLQCSKIDRTRIQNSFSMLSGIIVTSFECGIEYLKKRPGQVSAAAEAILILFSKADTGGHVTQSSSDGIKLDAMRVESLAAGALVSNDCDFLPLKLTPIVRSLMTSLQNERDEECLATSCGYMATLLKLLAGPVPPDRSMSLSKTRLKILQNLCNFVQADQEPSCLGATRVIGLVVQNLGPASLETITPIWDCVSSLLQTDRLEETMLEELLVLKAVCKGLRKGQHAASRVIKTFLCILGSIHCQSPDASVRQGASECVGILCSVEETLSLNTLLPTIATTLNDEHAPQRVRASQLLVIMLDRVSMAICPFVRSLLPLSMSLMTDPVQECAKAAASIFSRLVQLAPLVKESTPLPLVEVKSSGKADQVIDHLIHGKPLPLCEMHTEVSGALKAAGVTLRGYQMDGVAWVRFLQSVRLNGALTDSMGLGKTLQSLVGVALAHMDVGEGVSPVSLVVCPSSVVGHWMQEIVRFFPGESVFRPYRLNEKTSKTFDASKLGGCNILVTSYAMLRTKSAVLGAVRWLYCVLDEGHLLKNPKTATAQAARKIRARHKLILTGTPVQNKVHEVWAAFDWLMPNFLGSASEFSTDFARPITKSQSPGASATDIAAGLDKLKVLHQQVLPFILRREKEQVLKELPPKCISTIPCDMSPIQARLYNHICSREGVKTSLEALEKAIDKSESMEKDRLQSMGTGGFKALLYLRLLCTHPILISDKWNTFDSGMYQIDCSGKLVALKHLLVEVGLQSKNVGAADNDSSLLYINAEEEENVATDEIRKATQGGPDEDAYLSTIDSSATSNGSKCLIFAQFTHSLDVVEEALLKRHFPGTSYLRLDGKIPADQRSGIVDTFNNDNSIKILLITTRIGGLGLNLTGADIVIFLEHDWNPHADLQAMDRAHRIGQKKTVNVYKLITTDSIEEKIMKLHDTKLAMSNAIVNTENSTLYSMGTDRLLDIFSFRSGKSDSKADRDAQDTLDSLVELYAEEYSSLSVGGFIQGFKPVSND